MVGSRRLCRDADPSTGTNSVLVTRLGGEADGCIGLRSFWTGQQLCLRVDRNAWRLPGNEFFAVGAQLPGG